MNPLTALYDAAIALKDQGNLPGAVAKLEEIIQQDPNHGLAHQTLAIYVQKLGDYERAIQEALKVAEIAPDDPFSYMQLSVIYQRCGRIQEAEDAMAKSKAMQAGH